VVITAGSGGSGTTYAVSDPSPSVATATTNVAGSPGTLITDVAAGSDTLTVTRNGTSLTCTVAIVCAGPGTGNEPSGMTPQINTGDMTTAPNQAGGNASWAEGTIISSTFYNFTNPTVPAPPYSASNVYTNPALIALAPDGPGLEVQYNTTCGGQNNPVSWGVALSVPASPQGVLYISCLVRARGWNNVGRSASQISAVKLMEPRCGQNGENHVVAGFTSSSTDNYLGTDLQGSPTADNYPKLDQSPYSAINVYVPNADLQFNQSTTWRLFQLLMGQETTPGVSGDAYIKYWVGAKGSTPTLAYDTTQTGSGSGAGTWLATGPIDMLQPASTKGWFYLMFNQTYGGSVSYANGPPSTMYLGLNQLYASQK
jgi:hypothetical protein